MKLVSWAEESHAALSKDKKLCKHAKTHGPPEIEICKDHFRMLARSIAGQQLSGTAAFAIFTKVTATVGEICPENLLAAGYDNLRSAGLSNAKTGTLLALSEACLNGLSMKTIERLPNDDVVEKLTAIKGIGPWTAEMFLMFGLGRPDVMSAGDLGLRKGLQFVHGLPELPLPQDCEKLFEPWRPFRTAASWYLWRAIEPVKGRNCS